MDYDFLETWKRICNELGVDWQDELNEARSEAQSLLDIEKPWASLMEIEEFLIQNYGLEADYIEQFIY